MPSAETATEVPCCASLELLVPTSLFPCWPPGYGVAVTEKLPVPVAEPSAVVIEIIPVVAPGMTMPTNVVPVLETTMAAVPPIVKAVGLSRLVPVMVTSVPTGPVEGVKEVKLGPQTNCVINAPETVLVAVPQVPVTTQ